MLSIAGEISMPIDGFGSGTKTLAEGVKKESRSSVERPALAKITSIGGSPPKMNGPTSKARR